MSKERFGNTIRFFDNLCLNIQNYRYKTFLQAEVFQFFGKEPDGLCIGNEDGEVGQAEKITEGGTVFLEVPGYEIPQKTLDRAEEVA